MKLNEDGSSLGESKVFAECNAGLFDGFRFDSEDRLWASAADGVHCFAKDVGFLFLYCIKISGDSSPDPEVDEHLSEWDEILDTILI